MGSPGTFSLSPQVQSLGSASAGAGAILKRLRNSKMAGKGRIHSDGSLVEDSHGVNDSDKTYSSSGKNSSSCLIDGNDVDLDLIQVSYGLPKANQSKTIGPTIGSEPLEGLWVRRITRTQTITFRSRKMSQPANDDFSQHLSDDEASYHEDASENGTATNKPKQQQQQQLIPTTTTISNIKLPILKKEEYDIWAMEMEHYLEYIDNDVWKVIQNGNSKKRISTGKDGVVRILPPVSAAEIHAVEKERKARTILLMAIPKEHLRRFHGMDDAKEIWEAIRTRFGGNANSKKMQSCF
ncbi:hypothetical protein Tco_0217255 [Tanacetum coccineum]